MVLQIVERLAAEVGVANRLHLWPDKSLGNISVANRMLKPRNYMRWLRKSWSRVTEWPSWSRVPQLAIAGVIVTIHRRIPV